MGADLTAVADTFGHFCRPELLFIVATNNTGVIR